MASVTRVNAPLLLKFVFDRVVVVNTAPNVDIDLWLTADGVVESHNHFDPDSEWLE